MARMNKKEDPTRQQGNRVAYDKALRRRLVQAKKDIMEIFNGLDYSTWRESKIINSLTVNTVYYDYNISPEQMLALADAIQQAIEFRLETGRKTLPKNWFMYEYIEKPFRQGTLAELREIEKAIRDATLAGGLVSEAIEVVTTPGKFLKGTSYRKKLQMAHATNYQQVKTLSQETAQSVFKRIQLGISSGKNPKSISRDITKRFDVSKSNANRIARTEVNAAYNNAKLDTADIVEEQNGIKLGVIHVSALTATTRSNHARRHGMVYTTSDQKSWWSDDANRINCLCSTQTVTVDREGKPLNFEMVDEIKQEGDEFFK